MAAETKRPKDAGSSSGQGLSMASPGTGGPKGGHKISGTNVGRVQVVMSSAEKSGLLNEKDGRITGRVSTHLINEAKARTGIESDTDLIAFALASIALQDNFAEAFRSIEGTVDPNLDLEF